MDGLLRCTRYAFGPNRLHYCGPDANREILSYMESGLADPGLETLLRQFQTMFPYLKLIAEANGIKDPFDDRVVEAYWLGNKLLENVGRQRLHRHLLETLGLKKRSAPKTITELERQVAAGPLPHHNFHVFDVWRLADKKGISGSVAALDGCRITPAKVLTVDGPSITIEYEPVIEKDGRLTLGGTMTRKIRRALESLTDIEQLAPGQFISVHWDVPCEVISKKAAARLKKLTEQMLANAIT